MSSVSLFLFDDGFSWTGVCVDKGVVTVGDDGTGVIIQPEFKNVVVAIEHETKGEVLISADESAGPDVSLLGTIALVVKLVQMQKVLKMEPSAVLMLLDSMSPKLGRDQSC